MIHTATYPMPGYRRRPALGSIAASSEISGGVSAAGAGVAAAASAGLLTTIGITSAAVPFIGPIVAGVTLLIGALGIGNGCGGTCTEATHVVDQAEPALKQNLAAAQQAVAQNGCLTQDELTQLVANFNTVWTQVQQQCGQIPAPGGTHCISDRQPGGKLDWTAYYLTPIQQMPVCPVPVSSPAPAGGLASIGWTDLAIPALLVLGAFLVK